MHIKIPGCFGAEIFFFLCRIRNYEVFMISRVCPVARHYRQVELRILSKCRNIVGCENIPMVLLLKKLLKKSKAGDLMPEKVKEPRLWPDGQIPNDSV